MTAQSDDLIEIRLEIDNAAGGLSKIVLEPWADEIDIRKGDRVSLLASGPREGARIDQECEEGVLILHAWRGWTFSVSLNDRKIATASTAIPSI